MARVFPPHAVARGIGAHSVVIEAGTLGQLIREGSRRYGERWTEGIARTTVLVNGYNAASRGGMSLPLKPDDRVHFISPAGGG